MKRNRLVFSAFLFFLLIASSEGQAGAGEVGYVLYLPGASRMNPWQEVGDGSASGGGISNNPGYSYNPAIAAGPDGTIYVAWQDSSDGDKDIYVRRWDGANWVEVGAGSASGNGISDIGNSYYPAIAVAPDGIVYVTWEEYDMSGPDTEIFVRRWNNSVWEEVGPGAATWGGISHNTGSSRRPSIAITPDGTPYISWQDDSGGSKEIYVRRWDGESWAQVGQGSARGGGISNNGGWSAHPSIAVDSDGVPYIAWENTGTGNYEIFVRRFNGSVWEEVGPDSAQNGGVSSDPDYSYQPSIALAPDGAPFIAWWSYPGWNGDTEIYVRRFNGSNWVQVGPGSAAGGGISNDANDSLTPSIANDADGTVYVTWVNTDIQGENFDIYVRRWSGSVWTEVGPGSAQEAGISWSVGLSRNPVITLAPDGNVYISWDDTSTGMTEIFIRRYER